ncbi:hypothetical protein PHPALM_28835 [Phytophthora palmivora]|uniref:Kinesin motor domain-containing protein n=1 Tax=Phytophthora palmivora TaxID=4796 RepID=A0A2P4X923_9STRA|nr:hypothetical protein PHPALM_28835 [Phytophthora palmivora]
MSAPSPNSVVGDESTSKMLVLRANYSNGELFLREAATNADDNQEVRGGVFSHRTRGCNACVTTFVGAPSLRIGGSTAQQTVLELVQRELFATVAANGDSRFHRAKFTISFLAVFNETVYDLLGLEAMTAPSTEAKSSTARQIVVLKVQNAEETLMVFTGGHEY